MLVNLYLENIVLVKRLNLEFDGGFTVLSGETGAGKSVILNSISLVLGAKSNSKLIRYGCEVGIISVGFDITNNLKLHRILKENGITFEPLEPLIIRREINNNGSSKSWIGTQLVSVHSLKLLAPYLVEIHGQFETSSIFNVNTHLSLLDEFSGHKKLLQQVADTYNKMKHKEKQFVKLQDKLKENEQEKEFLSYNIDEIEEFDLQQQEEEELHKKRQELQQVEKTLEAIKNAIYMISANNGIEYNLQKLTRIVESIMTEDENIEKAINMLYSAFENIAEVKNIIDYKKDELLQNSYSLDEVEERLFAIRALARKHNTPPHNLLNILENMKKQLESIESDQESLVEVEGELKEFKEEYLSLASKLSESRQKQASKLEALIQKELKYLKLNDGEFRVKFKNNKQEEYSLKGLEQVEFFIKTNKGTEFNELALTASGGEISRVMLAIRMILAKSSDFNTIIFDEIDIGVGGATAHAIGSRMLKLSKNMQVMAITHSAQVAALGDSHFKVIKYNEKGTTVSSIGLLNCEEREQELARMFSGKEITEEAQAAAKKLLKRH